MIILTSASRVVARELVTVMVVHEAPSQRRQIADREIHTIPIKRLRSLESATWDQVLGPLSIQLMQTHHSSPDLLPCESTTTNMPTFRSLTTDIASFSLAKSTTSNLITRLALWL